MPLSIYAVHHDIPPSCVLALPEKERQPGQECACEGKPHQRDWVKVKPKFSYGEKMDLATKMSENPAYALCWMVERGVVEWSLRDTTTRLATPIADATGEPLPITAASVYDLDEETVDFLTGLWEDKKPTAGDGDGPKGRARRSPKR